MLVSARLDHLNICDQQYFSTVYKKIYIKAKDKTMQQMEIFVVNTVVLSSEFVVNTVVVSLEFVEDTVLFS